MAGPTMMGDFGGFCAQRPILVPSVRTVTIINSANQQMSVPSLERVVVCDPIASRIGSGFKVADNESALPQDRVFCTYNYYNDAGGVGGFNQPFMIQAGPGTTVSVPGVVVPARRVDVHRELFGFEKTFLDGNASFELRLPVFQVAGKSSVAGDDFGDLTVLMKYALLIDRNAGNALSVGLALTAPTGPGIDTVGGTIHSTLFQPYAGLLINTGSAFIQGFSSIVVPTDGHDVTVWFNDIGFGYNLYRHRGDGFITGIAPALEVHITSPLDNQSAGALIVSHNIVSLTAGAYVGLRERCVLSLGANVPISGTRPYEMEGLAQLNFRF
jgi:hypothetical protein